MNFYRKLKHRVWKLRHFGFHKPTDFELALKFCELNPSAKKSISGAGRRLEKKEADLAANEKAHRFTGSAPWATCIYCHKQRENAFRFSCENWEPAPNIEEIVRAEEELFTKLVARGRKIIEAIPSGELTGEKLADLHHTHGIGPDVLEFIWGKKLSADFANAYATAYERHKATGSKGRKKVVLIAR